MLGRKKLGSKYKIFSRGFRMGAKVRIKGFKQIRDKINKQLKDASVDRGLMDGIGKILMTEVKETIRSGVSPKTDREFKDLKESTIKKRKRFAKNKQGRKSPHFRADFSNLTQTGQMVRSLKAKIVGNQVSISFTGGRTVNGKTITNQKLADIHDEGNINLPKRSVFGIPKGTQKKVVKALNEFLKRNIK